MGTWTVERGHGRWQDHMRYMQGAGVDTQRQLFDAKTLVDKAGTVLSVPSGTMSDVHAVKMPIGREQSAEMVPLLLALAPSL